MLYSWDDLESYITEYNLVFAKTTTQIQLANICGERSAGALAIFTLFKSVEMAGRAAAQGGRGEQEGERASERERGRERKRERRREREEASGRERERKRERMRERERER